MTIFEQLSNQSIILNDTEKKIVDYILQNFDHLGTIKNISEDLFISPNTIIRLCKKLGYKGFSELKYTISQNQLKKEDDTGNNYDIKEFLEYTFSINSPDKIRLAAKTMFDCNQLVIFALGLSHVVALDLSKKLVHLNKFVFVPDDRDNCKLYASNLQKGQAAMIMSLSGNTDIMKNITYIAKAKNIPIITLTGWGQNAVASLGDINLFAFYNKLTVNHYDVSSRLGLYMLTELIFQEYIKLYYAQEPV